MVVEASTQIRSVNKRKCLKLIHTNTPHNPSPSHPWAEVRLVVGCASWKLFFFTPVLSHSRDNKTVCKA